MNFASRFTFLNAVDPELFQLCITAEDFYQQEQWKHCLIELRQFGEVLAKEIANQSNLFLLPESQADLISLLKKNKVINSDIAEAFHSIRVAGNEAVHKRLGNRDVAISQLSYAYMLGLWYCRCFKNLSIAVSQEESVETKVELGESYIDKQNRILKKISEHTSLIQSLINEINYISDQQSKKIKRIIIEYDEMQKKSKERIKNEQNRKSLLLSQQSQLQLSLIEIDIKIHDIKDYCINSEIKVSLEKYQSQKQATQSKLEKINLELESLNCKGFNAIEQSKIEALKGELSEIKKSKDQLQYELQMTVDSEKAKVTQLLQTYDLLFNQACNAGSSSQDIPFDLISLIDRFEIKIPVIKHRKLTL